MTSRPMYNAHEHQSSALRRQRNPSIRNSKHVMSCPHCDTPPTILRWPRQVTLVLMGCTAMLTASTHNYALCASALAFTCTSSSHSRASKDCIRASFLSSTTSCCFSSTSSAAFSAAKKAINPAERFHRLLRRRENALSSTHARARQRRGEIGGKALK